MIAVRSLDDAGAIYFVLPAAVRRAKNDLRLGPVKAISTFHQRNALLRPPTKPHPVAIALLQDADVKASPQLAAKHGIVLVFEPASPGGAGGGMRFTCVGTGVCGETRQQKRERREPPRINS